MTKALPRSSQIVLSAIESHMRETGTLQKAIAIDAGFENPNYISMIKSGDRVSLSRIPGLKRALPNLDDHTLTATVFSEMFKSDEAEAAIASLIEFLAQQPPFESAVLRIATEVRGDAEASGLAVPADLSAEVKNSIRTALKDAVQLETALVHDLA